jgi:hypothetical protein
MIEVTGYDRGATNNGMHPTADTPDFIFGNRTGRRVMPGVRLLAYVWPAHLVLGSSDEGCASNV